MAAKLASYGCTDIVRLDEKLTTPEQLDYLDLLPTRSNEAPILSAVAAHQGTALLYVLDASGASGVASSTLGDISRQLANRSDPAWLGVLKPGSLEIFPIGFHERGGIRPVKTIDKDDASAPLFFQSLVHGTFEENSKLKGTDYVYRQIFDLLIQTTAKFVPKEGKGAIDFLEVLSMAGRALFFRFLIDRRIVLQKELQGADGICPEVGELKDAFSSAEKAARTSAWLDSTFNGDFLPLIDEAIPTANLEEREREYLAFYRRVEGLVGPVIFSHLHAILQGWKAVGGGFQRKLDWGDLDFAHIPVGVLSQVYESFSHRADPRTARDTSVHYTPRTIANFMVDEAFAAVENPSTAKVLDSACGAGIFLVLTYRRLVRERWLRDKERPRTAVIQEILYNQIRGFDISESALRLAALALYITAIELNATQRPPQSLKFPRNIRGEVLYRFGLTEQASSSTAFTLGSLGDEVPAHFAKSFDVVIGNPPWTRLRDEISEAGEEEGGETASETDEMNKEFTKIGRRVLTSRGFAAQAKKYQNPDKNPDLPFLWRSAEWAKDDGVIALAMHARLFLRSRGPGRDAWLNVLKTIRVTGLLNGSDLRKTAAWEGMDAPFCLFFARNNAPEDGQEFQFASPNYEPDLNGRGRIRIDYEAAHQISVESAEKYSWLLKTLSLGTQIDVDLMERLLDLQWHTIGAFWKKFDSSLNSTGQGYNRSPRLAQKPAEFLENLPDFERQCDFLIDYEKLITYKEKHGNSSAHMPRTERLYQSPLVIIPKAPGDDTEAPRAYISNRPLTFSQSYYGYSCDGHPESETVASLVYLLPHSTLFAYFCLMTSRNSGFDFQMFNKEEFEAIPFPDIKKLSDADKAEIKDLATKLQYDSRKPWREMNELIFRLYGMGVDEVQVATDTLFTTASYRKVGRPALEIIDRPCRDNFVNALREELDPYFDVCGERCHIEDAKFQPDVWQESWYFLAISRVGSNVPADPDLLTRVMELANRHGSSRIMVRTPGNRGLLLGLLNRKRWWTITRARLCAQHIIRDHIDAFGLTGE